MDNAFQSILEDSKELLEEYKVTLRTTQNPGIYELDFADGRLYQFQRVRYLELHELLLDKSKALETEALKLGMEKLYSKNAKSPKIDETYLEQNRKEAWGFWSTMLRRLVLRG